MTPVGSSPERRCIAEGQDQPLTVDWSQNDGPGILVRFRELPRPRVRGDPARRLPRGGRRRPMPGPRAAGTGTRSSGARDHLHGRATWASVTDIFRTGGSEVFVVEGDPGARCWSPRSSAVMVRVRCLPRVASWWTLRRSRSTTSSPGHACAVGGPPAPGRTVRRGIVAASPPRRGDAVAVGDPMAPGRRPAVDPPAT